MKSISCLSFIKAEILSNMHAPREVLTYPKRTQSACQSQPKKNHLRAVSLRFAPVVWLLSDLEVRGRKEKEEKEERKKKEY